jgi:Flp pilus assembly pilin Flp
MAMNKGQNITEYGLILAVVMVAFLAMNTYFKRGIQSVIKATADDLGSAAQEEYKLIAGCATVVSCQTLGSIESGLVSSAQPRPSVFSQNVTLWDNTTDGAQRRNSTVVSSSSMAVTATYSVDPGESFSLYEKMQNSPGQTMKLPNQPGQTPSAPSPNNITIP